MNKLLEKNKLAEKHNLYNYHSGGGCFHLALDTDIDEIMWLINDVIDDNEPSQDYPTREDQRCIFGIDLIYMEDESLKNKVIKILDDYDLCRDWGFDTPFFYDVFSNGITKVKRINEEISALVKEVA